MATKFFSLSFVPGVLGKSLFHGADVILEYYLAGKEIRCSIYLTILGSHNSHAVVTTLITLFIFVDIDGLEQLWRYESTKYNYIQLTKIHKQCTLFYSAAGAVPL